MDPATTEMVSQIAVASIAIVPATLAAIWARRANSNSKTALHEVQSNGGTPSDPARTLKDYIEHGVLKMETADEKVEKLASEFVSLGESLSKLNTNFEAHLAHSAIMDRALADVYLKVNVNPTPQS